jgi:hypothetical protein
MLVPASLVLLGLMLVAVVVFVLISALGLIPGM